MNKVTEEKPVRWLFLDLNAYFASCEQQENPQLRGKPIMVVQMIAETACAIAASYEAKRFGIRTGMLVRDARKLCPDIVPVKAQHKLYTTYHERILKAVDSCMPIEKVVSIDEMACRLLDKECDIEIAKTLALKIKDAIRRQVGECMTCSIGIAPNVFLGKVGSDIQKPDGLVVVTKDRLPDILAGLQLQDIYGIGRRMEQRLKQAGIHDVFQLWAASSFQLRRVWGGIGGVLFHQMLHGVDVQPPSSAFTKSMGHQHVLEPELRTQQGAKKFAMHLLAKAAERLRRNHYYCRRLGVYVSWMGEHPGWWNETDFHETQDSVFLMQRLEHLWRQLPPHKPMRVNVVLMGLVPATRHQLDLFAHNPRQQRLSALLDKINSRYGRNSVTFGLPPEKIRAFRGHAAFQRVPESWEF